jgi:hypothetical protein
LQLVGGRNLAIVRAFRARAEQQTARIGATEPPREIGRRIRDFGLEMYRLTAEWCDALEEAILAGELDDAPAEPPPPLACAGPAQDRSRRRRLVGCPR